MVGLAAIGLLVAAATNSIQANSNVPAPEFVNWTGFHYLPAQGRVVEPHFPIPGDWTPPTAAFNALPSEAKAVEWPIRIFILKRIDRIQHLEDGTLYEEQCALENSDTERITRAIEGFKQLVAVESGGAVTLNAQVTVDSEPLRLESRSFEQAVTDYVTPRINGGKFEAEDKLFRGPYSSVFVIHPASDKQGSLLKINGTQVDAFSAYGFPGFEAEGQLSKRLSEAWIQDLKTISRQTGLLGPLDGISPTNPITRLENPYRYVPNQNWSALLKGPNLSAQDIADRLKLATTSNSSAIPNDRTATGYKGETCTIELTQDTIHGNILRYAERGNARDGGLNFPMVHGEGAGISVLKTPTLSFWVRSSSKDPLALELVGVSGKIYQVSIGQDLPGGQKAFEASIARDGAWHLAKVDLRRSGFDSILQLRLAPTLNSLLHPKITQGPILYEFADFSVTNDSPDGPWQSPNPSADSTDPTLRARWAHTAKPSIQLLALLKDPQWIVRLNAIQPYIAEPELGAEAALTENANLSIDGPTAVAALDALWKLGTPSAKDVIHATLKTGVTEQGKAEAARLVGASKDPTVASELIPLQQSRGLATRIAVVRVLGDLPGESAAVIRMTFLYQDDPELKLAVTETSNGNDPYQWKKLLWSAVNEGSDAVRLVSYEKLLDSSDSAAKAAGYAGVKDDSLGVRVQFLHYLAAHPSEENRPWLRQAVVDRSPLVRAAALGAFGTLEKGFTLEELGSALSDSHPVVQLAIIELTVKKKLVLPEEVRKQILASADPVVRAAAKSFG